MLTDKFISRRNTEISTEIHGGPDTVYFLREIRSQGMEHDEIPLRVTPCIPLYLSVKHKLVN
jgi:hypothetical protein